MPETFGELTAIFSKLENHYRDMQDIEFTVQEGDEVLAMVTPESEDDVRRILAGD